MTTVDENLKNLFNDLKQETKDLSDTLKDLVDNLNKANDLDALLRAYVVAKSGYEAFDDVRKQIGLTLDRCSREIIPEMLDSRNIRSMALSDMNCRIATQTRVSCSMPDKLGGMKWLQENGHGDLIQETVNSSSLAAFARKYIEEEGMDLPDSFKVSSMRVTSITKL